MCSRTWACSNPREGPAPTDLREGRSSSSRVPALRSGELAWQLSFTLGGQYLALVLELGLGKLGCLCKGTLVGSGRGWAGILASFCPDCFPPCQYQPGS